MLLLRALVAMPCLCWVNINIDVVLCYDVVLWCSVVWPAQHRGPQSDWLKIILSHQLTVSWFTRPMRRQWARVLWKHGTNGNTEEGERERERERDSNLGEITRHHWSHSTPKIFHNKTFSAALLRSMLILRLKLCMLLPAAEPVLQCCMICLHCDKMLGDIVRQ